MAVYFESSNPKQLLAAFDAAIALNNKAGGIATWEKLPSGHYTHESSQWKRRAFFLPTLSVTRLIFNIKNPEGLTINIPTYGYYHGHLIETMLNHFDKLFSVSSATALPVINDSTA